MHREGNPQKSHLWRHHGVWEIAISCFHIRYGNEVGVGLISVSLLPHCGGNEAFPELGQVPLPNSLGDRTFFMRLIIASCNYFAFF